MDTFLRPNSIFDDGKKSSTMCSLARSFASFLPAKKAVKTILFGKAFSSRDKSRFSKCFRSMSERWKWYNRRQKVFNIIFALFERIPKLFGCLDEIATCETYPTIELSQAFGNRTKARRNWFWYFVFFFGELSLARIRLLCKWKSLLRVFQNDN